jgi:hypothetical protein
VFIRQEQYVLLAFHCPPREVIFCQRQRSCDPRVQQNICELRFAPGRVALLILLCKGISDNHKWTLALSIFYVGYCMCSVFAILDRLTLMEVLLEMPLLMVSEAELDLKSF